MLKTIGLETFNIIAISAPWLLVGFLIAGFVHFLLPKSKLINSLRQPGFSSILKASLIGIPLPLCSCSVIPVAVSLRRSGASKGATSAFLVSTPEIGVDSFLLSMSLLGLPLTILRTLMAFLSSMLCGLCVGWGEVAPEVKTEEVKSEAFSISRAVHYGYITLAKDLANLLVIGFIIAGFASYFIPENYLFSDSVFVKPLALLLSFPVYVCATSMTPLAAIFLAKGLSAGTVLIFLLAGPASNISTMLAVKKELGTEGLVKYLLSVSGTILLMSYLVDALLPSRWFSEVANTVSNHIHGSSSNFEFISGLLLIALLSYALWANAQDKKSCCSGGK